MMKMATRIRDRAIRRAGELLEQVETQQGKRNDIITSGERPPEVNRQQVATATEQVEERAAMGEKD
ncbi:hypothetical protein [Nitrobacter sp. JJSN]|uniref:hypothetical protein n=1 Tax=Nitrobacter sp. JJSN TaxID=3453033 RepID=UPI003F763BDD